MIGADMSRPKRSGGQSVTIPLSTYGARLLLAWTTALRRGRLPMENCARATGTAATIATRMGGDAGRGSGRRQGRRLERDPTEREGAAKTTVRRLYLQLLPESLQSSTTEKCARTGSGRPPGSPCA